MAPPRGDKKPLAPVTRRYTVHLHKRLWKVGNKKRAPRAIKELRAFAQKMMSTKDVRIDADLNKMVWSRGIKNVPFRIRVQIARKRNEDEDAAEPMYSLVTFVSLTNLKGTVTERVNGGDDEETSDN